MRLVIASDIHGSAKYCAQLLECYDKEQAERLVLLGDILYHGPRNDLPDQYAPKTVIEQLNERKDEIICVRGNCDTEVDQMVLKFSVMSGQGVIFADGYTFVMAHGHKLNGPDRPALCDKNVLLCGHTHVPKAEWQPVDPEDETKGTYLYLNPGSVSIPKENSWHGYILYENGTFTMKDFEGNIKKVINL